MFFKSLNILIKYLIFFNLKGLLILLLFFNPIFLIGQNQNNYVSEVSVEKDLNAEIISLEIKRGNLLNRKHQLNNGLDENVDQINRIDEMVKYIDNELINLHFQLKLEEVYLKNGKTKKDLLSTEEYIKLKQEWVKLNKEKQFKQIVLKRSELERLPKERQDKVLSMPERYLIIED